MENLICLFLIIVALASKIGLSSGHQCPKKSNKNCTTHGDCPSGQACLGTEGNLICRDCECHQTSQCHLQGNNVKCNCTNSGYSGHHCECEKKNHSDIVFWHSHCLKYSDEFLILDNGFWTGDCSGAMKFFTMSTAYCFQQCVDRPTCYVVFYEGHSSICNLFVYSTPPMLGDIMDKVVRSAWNSRSEVRVRNCVERVLDED
ncbi:uncharacterized protein LOC132736452 [Ruditapes philippinarum]|uniref:uncharacterized protein LOC132736452 n=1 Tax=Ruditapes philippinarum TaxID=129788 RepID=UPI00295A86AA|nr:uncharacterized protein LOC132736452 [Ruditapes philippinarum]